MNILKRKLELHYTIKGIIPEELKEDAALVAAFHSDGCLTDEQYITFLNNEDLLKYKRDNFRFSLMIHERHIKA